MAWIHFALERSGSASRINLGSPRTMSQSEGSEVICRSSRLADSIRRAYSPALEARMRRFGMQELYSLLLSFQSPKCSHNAGEKGGRHQSKNDVCNLNIFRFCFCVIYIRNCGV